MTRATKGSQWIINSGSFMTVILRLIAMISADIRRKTHLHFTILGIMLSLFGAASSKGRCSYVIWPDIVCFIDTISQTQTFRFYSSFRGKP